jgi:hypothetical protein
MRCNVWVTLMAGDGVDGGAMGESDGDGRRQMSMTFNKSASKRRG